MPTPNEVQILAQAIIDTLTKFTAKERQATPMAGYVQRINEIIGMAKQAAPNIDQQLWPKPIKIEEVDCVEQVFGGYADVETAARQIMGLLDSIQSTGGGKLIRR